MSNLENSRCAFHTNMMTLEEIKKNWKDDVINRITALHNKNNERISNIITILQDESKYLWNYCSGSKAKWYDPHSDDLLSYVGTIRHNIVIPVDGVYENATLEFDIINIPNKDRYIVNSVSIFYNKIEYRFVEQIFKPNDNILDYVDSIEECSKHIDWLEGGVEGMFNFLTNISKKEIERLKSRTTI